MGRSLRACSSPIHQTFHSSRNALENEIQGLGLRPATPCRNEDVTCGRCDDRTRHCRPSTPRSGAERLRAVVFPAVLGSRTTQVDPLNLGPEGCTAGFDACVGPTRNGTSGARRAPGQSTSCQRDARPGTPSLGCRISLAPSVAPRERPACAGATQLPAPRATLSAMLQPRFPFERDRPVGPLLRPRTTSLQTDSCATLLAGGCARADDPA